MALNLSAVTIQPCKLVMITALCLESIFNDIVLYLADFLVAAQMLLCCSLFSYPKNNLSLYIGNGRYQSFLVQLFHLSRGKATTQLYTFIN